jgi:hypothetical protein
MPVGHSYIIDYETPNGVFLYVCYLSIDMDALTGKSELNSPALSLEQGHKKRIGHHLHFLQLPKKNVHLNSTIQRLQEYWRPSP